MYNTAMELLGEQEELLGDVEKDFGRCRGEEKLKDKKIHKQIDLWQANADINTELCAGSGQGNDINTWCEKFSFSLKNILAKVSPWNERE